MRLLGGEFARWGIFEKTHSKLTVTQGTRQCGTDHASPNNEYVIVLIHAVPRSEVKINYPPRLEGNSTIELEPVII
jgi:hypothetical protein